MKGKFRVLLIILVLLGAVGGVIGYRYLATKDQQVDQKTTVRSQMKMQVQRGTLRQTVGASGNIQAVQQKDVTVRSGGYVEQINFAIGDRVAKGDILLALNNREEKLNYLKQQNQFKSVQINGSPSEVEEAKISLEIAQEKLTEKELRAPFSGVIVDLQVEEGDYVGNNQVVVKLMDDSNFEVEVDIDESEARYLKVGQSVVVTLEALPGQQMAGKVIEVGRNADINSGVVTFPVTIQLAEKDSNLKVGYSADVEIVVGLAENQVIIPITAILHQGGRDVVMREVDGKVGPVPVKTGLTDGLKIAIEAGLEAGDQILINTGSFAARSSLSNSNANSGMRVPGMFPGGTGGSGGGRRGGGF